MAVNMAGVACRGLRCVGGCKMSNDVGMVICKSIAVLFLPCFLGIPSLHVLSFKKKVFPVTRFCCLSGERRVWTVV